ncbi:Ig-like domain-containing protein [Tessaracoccus sp. ZS01]|uniref:FIMAH domain-containing protein n=1 Tax=Tessaracoccus sp. ZS01 TaxID=1906324 RepID=UPI0009F944FF|nr:Ig-like domain-containing protein [Tessaracoccus sp. ZS01]MCG6568519.1 hypothetical protein [Tessaracoccus sp. ZS01]
MSKKRLGMLSLIGALLFVNLSVLSAAGEEGSALPFILRNENFAFEERVAAVIIDAGKPVDGSSLSADDFDVHVVSTRKVDPEVVIYDGPREVAGVYTSQVNDWGQPSDSGQYIVLDFPHVGWGDGGTTIDNGYTLDASYTVTYQGEAIAYVDGATLVPEAFEQVGVVSPVLDLYQYATSDDGLDYAYFLNEEAEGPLPLVVYFHGGGQGNDNYTPARFSNGGTVWANPENRTEFPAHVLVPRTAGFGGTDVAAVKEVIDEWIAEGKVDPNRIYMTGYSMGSSSTWAFVRAYPEYVAAAVYGAGTGPGTPEFADAVSHMPLWEWVDMADFAYNGVINRFNAVGHLLTDYELTILPEVTLHEYPYNGWTFSGHSSWLVAYNEFTHEDRGTVFDWFFGISRIRGIEAVTVDTVSGVAPVLPATVTVDVNYNATGVVAEERSVVWDAIDPSSYGNDGPGVFTVEGTIDGVVEKAVATVSVEYRNRIADLKDLVADADLNKGNAHALTVKLDNAAKFIAQGDAEQAGEMLTAFINQVDALTNNKLTEAQAAELIHAAGETMRNIQE